MSRTSAPLPPTWAFGSASEPVRALLARGGVLAFPTESSYGLGADPLDPRGVERIFRLKGRSDAKPLPVVVADRSQLERLGVDPALPILERLDGIWPAPLSAVLPIARPIPASRGERSLAVRVPAHDALRNLLSEVGPLTATSANVSGEPAIGTAEEAAALLAGEDALVVAGRAPGGPPSTIVACSGPGGESVCLLRAGPVPLERLTSREGAA